MNIATKEFTSILLSIDYYHDVDMSGTHVRYLTFFRKGWDITFKLRAGKLKVF